ncbi:hypothetical protein TRV_04630 [Trichophyton verrucosum HKI 0517]|uniref:Fibronectin type-III domain-containing protein n=1 Tax=Trichophyton verrucosum (strain HKI 0517) TaxID=663202 RepID=D4DBX9_TRIVH|nr:uncharacterized protein TRV_04630 [Trichophyton verrucosum HKI 0517]EFE40581.1 hypothetical protein TRV_04630 [Trichophyton verrucosum HKI 0517]
MSDLPIQQTNVPLVGDQDAENSSTAGDKGLKLIVVGDSMTQGHEGDWTWRYRIWQWFREQNVTITFVGPYTGTVQPDRPKPPSPPPLYGSPKPRQGVKVDGGYARGVSADFDSHHFAVWGRTAALDKDLIEDVLMAHPADLMLLMLGFNDLGWLQSDALGTLRSIKTLVDNARRVNPFLKLAIANVPQRLMIGGREDLPCSTREYNNLLRCAIPQWSTADSPIHLVEVCEDYGCGPDGCPAGYDGLHPNATGEYEIARAFSLTLVRDFNIGSAPLVIPKNVPKRSLPRPKNFRVVSSPGGVTASWDAIYGAMSYDVRSRISGITEFHTSSVSSNRWDSQWTQEGWVYEVQVRASAGNALKGRWTAIKSAKSTPKTPPGPDNVIVNATTTGFDISWDSCPSGFNVTEYEILYWDKDKKHTFITSAGFKESPAHVDDLIPGHHYQLAIVSWNGAGGGFPKGVRSVTVGRGTPPIPTDLKITAKDATSAHLTWTGSPAAAGYQLWFRNVNEPDSELCRVNGTESKPSSDQYFLVPGVWNFEWCVSAFNGSAESDRCESVLAPRPSDASISSSDCSEEDTNSRHESAKDKDINGSLTPEHKHMPCTPTTQCETPLQEEDQGWGVLCGTCGHTEQDDIDCLGSGGSKQLHGDRCYRDECKHADCTNPECWIYVCDNSHAEKDDTVTKCDE